jgi:hypothetical protein
MRRRDLLMAGLATIAAPAAHSETGQPVVLELFTSQGCSSCPPADALLGVLSRQGGVIALAWHVDYWNNLGWRDPYASRFATDRQRAYAVQLHDEVYTPALVVNGAAVVVGSDRSAVTAAMAQTPAPSVGATLRRTGDAVIATIGTASAPLSALLAVYEPQHVTAVGAGENGGRRLTEYRIVRATHLADAGAGGGTLNFPAIKPQFGAVLLLQSAELRVVGAADLAPA